MYLVFILTKRKNKQARPCGKKSRFVDSGFVKTCDEHVINLCNRLGSAIKNLGLFSKSPGDFKMEKMDF